MARGAFSGAFAAIDRPRSVGREPRSGAPRNGLSVLPGVAPSSIASPTDARGGALFKLRDDPLTSVKEFYEIRILVSGGRLIVAGCNYVFA